MLNCLLLLSILGSLEAKIELIKEEKSRNNLRLDIPQIIGDWKLEVNMRYDKKQSSMLEQLKIKKNKGNRQSGKEISAKDKMSIGKQLVASSPQFRNLKNGIAEMGQQRNGWSQPKIMKPVSKQQTKPDGLLLNKIKGKFPSISKQFGQAYHPMKIETTSRDMESRKMKGSAMSLNILPATFDNPGVAQRSSSFSVSRQHKRKKFWRAFSQQNLHMEAKTLGLKSRVQKAVSVDKLNEHLHHQRAKSECNVNRPPKKKELWEHPPAPGMHSQGLLREQHIIREIMQEILELVRIKVSEKKEITVKKEALQEIVIRIGKSDFTIRRFKEIYSESLAEFSEAIGIEQNLRLAVELSAKIYSLKQEIQTLLRHIEEDIDNFKLSQSYEPSSTLRRNLVQNKSDDNQQKKPSDSANSWIKNVKRSFLSDLFSQDTEPQFFEKIKQLKNDVIKIIQNTDPVYRRLIGMPVLGGRLYGNPQIQKVKKQIISEQNKATILKPMCKYYVKNQLSDVMEFMQSAEVSLGKCLLQIKVGEILLDLELRKEQMKRKGKNESSV